MNSGSKDNIKKLNLFILATIIGILCVFPIYWMFISSFRPNSELFSSNLSLIPKTISFEHYQYAFKALPMFRIIGNTILVAVIRTLCSLFLCSLAGYAFSKLRFPGRRFLFLLLLATMAVPFESLVIPSFIIMVKFKWVNTYYPLIVPMAANAFGIFFMRQYINTLPDELMESALIDGCSFFKIYTKIILPLVKPALATLSIFIFKLAWNDFLWPMIVIRKTIMQVMPVAIQAIPPLTAATRNIPWGATMAAASISVLPLLIIFFVLQKHFVSGATQGALK